MKTKQTSRFKIRLNIAFPSNTFYYKLTNIYRKGGGKREAHCS